jgi:hypothetical protein
MFRAVQEETGRSAGPGRHDPAEKRATEESGRRTRRHMPHLPEDKVRGRCWTHLQLLQHPLLCPVRREGHPTLKQGKTNANLSITERATTETRPWHRGYSKELCG